MPAIISHYLLEERVYRILCDLRPELKINHCAMIWGASGPDFFFCHRLLPLSNQKSLRQYGTQMHNEPAEILLNYLVSYARYYEDDIVMSYVLGFITHYAFDSTAHPFVLYYADQMSYQKPKKHISICHNELEAHLDSLFLRRERGQKVSEFYIPSAAPLDRKVNQAIADAMQAYFMWKYRKSVYASEIVRAQKDWHYGLAVLNDRTGAKYRLVRGLEKQIGLKPLASPFFRRNYPSVKADYANLHHHTWFSEIDQKEYQDSFFDLALQAEEMSVQLISEILCDKKLTHEQCFRSFSGHQ